MPQENPPTLRIPRRDAGRELPVPGGFPSSFRSPMRLPVGEYSLRAVIEGVQAVTRNEIRVAPHTRDRVLLVHAEGAPASEVVTALQDLYGWTLRYQRDRIYFLGRPSHLVASNPREVHQRVRAALPPAIHRLWSDPADLVATPRYGYEFTRILKAIERQKGPGWTAVGMSELDRSTQRLLANLLFNRYARADLRHFGHREEAFWWLVAPEQGYFTLEGAGDHPLLRFCVRGPDGKIDTWGWGVGTSSQQ